MIDSGSNILLKTLQFYCFLFIGIVFVNCSKKTTTTTTATINNDNKGVVKTESKTDNTKEKAKPIKKVNKVKKKDSDDDVKFDLHIKEPEKKIDEFDDDEENPLAKIPIKPRQSKQTSKDVTASTSKTTLTASPGPPSAPSPAQEFEAPLFAANEKQIGSSCYVRLD